jgi:hypothetical protein
MSELLISDEIATVAVTRQYKIDNAVSPVVLPTCAAKDGQPYVCIAIPTLSGSGAKSTLLCRYSRKGSQLGDAELMG